MHREDPALPEPRASSDSDVRSGHDLAEVQDENGVDLLLLGANLERTVEERLLALEEYLRFVDGLGSAKSAP